MSESTKNSQENVQLPEGWEIVPHPDDAEFRPFIKRLREAGLKVFPARDAAPFGVMKGELKDPGFVGFPPAHSKWSGANMIGVKLADLLLNDLDDDKPGGVNAEDIAPYIRNAALFQCRQNGVSRHYLFRLKPDDFARLGTSLKHSNDGGAVKNVDIKTGNQLIYIKPGKRVRLSVLDNLQPPPAINLEALKKTAVDKSAEDCDPESLASFYQNPEANWQRLQLAIGLMRDGGKLHGGDNNRMRWVRSIACLSNFRGTEWEQEAFELCMSFCDDGGEQDTKDRFYGGKSYDLVESANWCDPLFMAKDIDPKFAAYIAQPDIHISEYFDGEQQYLEWENSRAKMDQRPTLPPLMKWQPLVDQLCQALIADGGEAGKLGVYQDKLFVHGLASGLEIYGLSLDAIRKAFGMMRYKAKGRQFIYPAFGDIRMCARADELDLQNETGEFIADRMQIYAMHAASIEKMEATKKGDDKSKRLTPAQAAVMANKLTTSTIDKLVRIIIASLSGPQQQVTTYSASVNMFTDSAFIRADQSASVFVFPYQPIPRPTIESGDGERVRDWLDHFPEFNEFLEWLVACRFASDRKPAYLWIQAPSDYGKGILTKGIMGWDEEHGEGLARTVSFTPDALAKIAAGAPAGYSSASFLHSWLLVVNEVEHITKDIKAMENSFSINQKGDSVITVPLYAKLFTSADNIANILTEYGPDSQMANRFAHWDFTGRPSILSRDLFVQDKGAYVAAIRRYTAHRIEELVGEYRALGRAKAMRIADGFLSRFIGDHRLGHGSGSIQDNIEQLRADFLVWVRDTATDSYRALPYLRHGVELRNGQTVTLLVNGLKAWERWAGDMHTEAVAATIRKPAVWNAVAVKDRWFKKHSPKTGPQVNGWIIEGMHLQSSETTEDLNSMDEISDESENA